MANVLQFLSSIREQMNTELTRSDVLRALIWPNAMLIFALVSGVLVNFPNWCLVTIFVMLSVFMSLYAGFYIYFALTDSDALRSEKYKLQKMAIEHGLYGDSQSGLVDLAPESGKDSNRLLVASTVNSDE